jgi:hypothetical protein
MIFGRFTISLKFKNEINYLTLDLLGVPGYAPKAILVQPTCGTRRPTRPACHTHIGRDRERQRPSFPPGTGNRGVGGAPPAEPNSGQGEADGGEKWLRIHPSARAPWLLVMDDREMDQSLLSMATGGSARAALVAVVHSGGRGREKGASRAACGSRGAAVFDRDREGVEELVGRRPWSSAWLAMASWQWRAPVAALYCGEERPEMVRWCSRERRRWCCASLGP